MGCVVTGLGLVPRGCFGDNRNCLGSGCGGIQPPHTQSSPTAWLGAVAHTCAPAPGGGTSPVWLLSVSHCVFQRCQCSQCPGALSWPHVSMLGAPAASGFAFPSLHPGLLLHWWWLGLLWLWGHPCSVGTGIVPSPGCLCSPALGLAVPHLWGSVVQQAWLSLVPLSCHSVLLVCQSPLGFPLPDVPVPGLTARWRGQY